MSSLVRYFKEHRWQRRVVTMLLVLIVGSIVGRLTYPAYLWFQRRQADLRLIEQLGDPDAYQREVAVQKSILLGQTRDELVGRLIDALDTPDDGRFESLHFVLTRLGKWGGPDLNPKWQDRYRLLEFRATFAEGEKQQIPSAQDRDTPTARLRRLLVRQALLCERDNTYIRQICSTAANDPAAIVRLAAAPLAARLGEDDILRNLLHDPAGEVRAIAALDAGLAKRTTLADSVRRLFDAQKNLLGPPTPDRADQLASAAYAMAMLDPQGSSEAICQAVQDSETQPDLQDRLLLALGIVNDEAAKQTILDLLHASRWVGRFPSGIALQVASQMQLAEATGMAMDVLRAAAEGETPLTALQMLGAIEVLSAAKYPCRGAIYRLCRALWEPNRGALLMRAARLLGQQAVMKGQVGDVPTRSQCVNTLQQAVLFSILREGQGKPVTTPMASAAAAVALWRLDPAGRVFGLQDDAQTQPSLSREEILNIVESRTSLFFLREAAAMADTAAGDYVAWYTGRSDLPEAVEAGEAFFPAEGSRPEYNPAVRACGAMILALAAKNDRQRRDVSERIIRRLKREEFPVVGSLQCALLMAGQEDQRANVRTLLELEEFSAARALLALLVAGDKTTLDWVLWNTNWNLPVLLEDIPPLLIDQVIGDVLNAVVPALPTISPAGSEATRLWQARILRHAYGIHRANLQVGKQR